MKTVFYQVVVDDCQAEPLHLAGMVIISTNEDANSAAEKLVNNNMKFGGGDYSVAYTAGHYGDIAHQWDFSYYDIYEPRDSKLPTMVILRYRPRRNGEMKTVFYEAATNDREAKVLHLAGRAILCSNEEAITVAENLIKANMKNGSSDYSVAYTAGHYGEVEHQWDFSHYEIYDPRDSNLSTMVILQYCPHNIQDE